MSSTLACRPSGIELGDVGLELVGGAADPDVGVHRAGRTALTVMPVGPSSRASDRVNPSTAALAAEYGVLENTPPPCWADTEDMFTIAAVAALDHLRQERLGDQVGAGRVDREHLVPQLQGGVQERHRGGDAGDVQHRTDGRQAGGGHRVPGGQHGVLVGDVDAAAERRDPVPLGQLGGQLLGGRRVQVEAGDGPAVGGEPVGGGAADTALGADPGDDDGALGGAHVGVNPLPGWVRDQCDRRGGREQLGDVGGRRGRRGGALVVGDVAGLQLQGEVTRVADAVSAR